jgi:hypothetical protein
MKHETMSTGMEAKKWTIHAYANQFLPVGMIHVSIQYLLSMSKGHPTDALGDVIEGCPQCLYDFPIDLFCSMNIAW